MVSTVPTKYRLVEHRLMEEVTDLVFLGRQFAIEMNEDNIFDPDAVHLSSVQLRADVKRERHNCFIMYDEELPVGVIFCSAYKTLYSKRVVSEQNMWYVLPEYRGTRVALSLLRAYEYWARSVGASRSFTGSSTKVHAERIKSTLIKLGYDCVGSQLVKEL